MRETRTPPLASDCNNQSQKPNKVKHLQQQLNRGATRKRATTMYQFINFSDKSLTNEQIKQINLAHGERETYEDKCIIHPVRIVSVENPSRFDDDGRKDVTEIIDAIAREIANLTQGYDAYVFFQISSPRVMAAFFEKKAKVKDFDDDVWNLVSHCAFVFPNEFEKQSNEAFILTSYSVGENSFLL